jgi:hypothetical protein
MQHNKILFIAFEFPPVNSGGSHRPFKLANAIANKGWQAIVLTADNNSSPNSARPDTSLVNGLHPSIKVIRSGLRPENTMDRFLVKGYGFVPDIAWRRWKDSLLKELPAVISEHQPAAIYLTCPPFSLYKLAGWLKKEYTSIPLIVDMRDAWSYWVISPYASRFHYRQVKRQEYQLLQLADRVLVTSRQTLTDFLQLHPKLDAAKFHYLPNGFTDFIDTANIPKHSGNKIRIGYVGSFYYNPATQEMMEKPWYKKKPYQWLQYIPRKENWRYRSPLYFFRLLSKFRQAYPELYSSIELHFAGKKPAWFDEMAAAYGLADIITHHGPVSQQDSIAFQASCDWLLITSAKVINGRDYSIAGKTFEYLSLRKPIIALVCEGAQKDLLSASGIACIIDPDKADEGLALLKSIVTGAFPVHPDKEFISGFKMDQLGNKFIMVVKQLTA